MLTEDEIKELYKQEMLKHIRESVKDDFNIMFKTAPGLKIKSNPTTQVVASPQLPFGDVVGFTDDDDEAGFTDDVTTIDGSHNHVRSKTIRLIKVNQILKIEGDVETSDKWRKAISSVKQKFGREFHHHYDIIKSVLVVKRYK
jgi:hypothetical protein